MELISSTIGVCFLIVGIYFLLAILSKFLHRTESLSDLIFGKLFYVAAAVIFFIFGVLVILN